MGATPSDLAAAQAAIDEAVTEGTTKEQALAWDRWQRYLATIGLGDDPFLDDLEQPERKRVISAFASAIRSGRFSHERFDRLAGPTVTDTIHRSIQKLPQAHPIFPFFIETSVHAIDM